ncbi:MAG: TetR/AcrR family transcriptional regulator [Candidatus Bipolaricaulota bacterium]|nr:TetR/AcrR family transcriptional regulator [Candidatus Bipolaricaulota bacterium]
MDDARERILEAGREMLLDGRLRDVTTNAIAERARMSKKTLYRIFPNKGRLLEAIVLEFVEANLRRGDAILTREGKAIGRILDLLGFFGEMIPRVQSLVVNQVQEVAPGLWRRIDAARMERVRALVRLFVEAQEEGDIRGDIDPDLWALLLMETVRHVLAPKTLYETGRSLPELAEAVQLVYFDGLLTEAGRAAVEGWRKEPR